MATRMPKRNDTIGLARTNHRAARILVHFFEVFLQNNNAKNKQTNLGSFSFSNDYDNGKENVT